MLLDDNMKTDIVIQALHSAITRRKPSKGLIHHSEKGSQYTSYRFQDELKHHHMQASFTGTGRCAKSLTNQTVLWDLAHRQLVLTMPSSKISGLPLKKDSSAQLISKLKKPLITVNVYTVL
jgi:hypothetical protein